jgi:acetyltransferase-like isoleucine patch superfamily enzyme
LTAWDSYRSDSFSPEIFIGNNTSIGEDFHITAINKIQIGNHVLIGKKVTITDNAHGLVDGSMLTIPPIERSLYSKGSVIIEDGVWIGDKVTILAGVTIGKNVIVGANSVVTKDIAKNCVVGGIPAKVLKIMQD